MVTIGVAVTEYIEARKADSLKPKTIEWYQGKLKPFVALFGSVSVDSFRVSDMRKYIVDLRESRLRYAGRPQARAGELSNESLRGHDKALRMFWSWAELEYALPKSANPMHKIKSPKKLPAPPKSATIEDVKTLIVTVAGSNSPTARRDLALMMYMADTGSRAAGTIGLTDDRLDLTRRQAVVYEKNDRVRTVFLNEPTVQAIERWLLVRPATATHVFCSLGTNTRGKPLTNSGLGGLLRRWGKVAGVTGRINPHAWRHMYARLFLLNGGQLAILSKLMGHSTIQITVEYYAIFTAAEHQEAHDKYSPANQLKGVINFGGGND